jgi:predicted ABC-type ATPase
MDKKILIIAGPNGAGKTTFAKSFLPQEAQCLSFVNADLIAAGLSPFEPEAAAIQAGRLMQVTQSGKRRLKGKALATHGTTTDFFQHQTACLDRSSFGFKR